MRRSIRRTGRKKTSRSFTSNRSILTKPEYSHALLASEAERQALAESRMNSVFWGKTPALAKRSFSAMGAYGSNPYYIEPAIKTGSDTYELTNLLAYHNSLKTTVRLDRDFTIAGRRFKVMGAPFALDEKVALNFAEGCIERALSNVPNNSLRGLVNLYHGIVGLYLSFLNRSFDCLDVLKIIQTSLMEGNQVRIRLLLTEVSSMIKEMTTTFKNIDTPGAKEKLAKAFALISPTIDNLEFGDGGPPDMLETMYGMAWEKLTTNYDKDTKALAKIRDEMPSLGLATPMSNFFSARATPTLNAFKNSLGMASNLIADSLSKGSGEETG